MKLANFSVLVIFIFVTACATRGLDTVEAKRAAVQEMKQEVLAQLYEEKPSVRAQIDSAAGHAVFDSANLTVILASVGSGYGVVRNSRTGEDTYMRMGELGVGFGAGVKDFSAVFVFHSEEAIDFFVDQGWAFGAQADAAAKAGKEGVATSGELLVNDVTVYQITDAGLLLQATVKGTKFWVDKSLNKNPEPDTE